MENQTQKLSVRSGIEVWSERVRRTRGLRATGETAVSAILETSFEELAVAEEELRVQEQQLAEASAALAAERARYQALFDQAPVPYVVTDAEAVIREANAAAADLLGVPHERLAGKPLIVFVAWLARQRFRAALNGLLEDAVSGSLLLHLTPRIGEIRLATAAVGVARDSRGRVVELRWLIVDETARRLHEQQLAALNAELEARVAERTAELRLRNREREELLHTAEHDRQTADQANRAKTELLTVVSHELRTPLAASMGYIDMLLSGARGALGETQRADLERVREAQAQVLHLMEDLLVYFRTGEGRLPVDISAVPVADAVRGALRMIEPQAREKGIRLRVSEHDVGLLALADPERLRQIVLNLLANAVKFTPTGGEVELGWGALGDTVEVYVRDTGRGIPADRAEHLFEPFVQLEQSSAGMNGFGLGLAISRGLARAMGGDLVVSSSGDAGSTFTVRVRQR